MKWWTPLGDLLVDSAGLRIAPSPGVEADPVGATADADVILVPGGDPESIIGDRPIATALRAADDRGAIVAAICAGVLVLADAGVASGRRITHNYRRPFAPVDVETFTAPFWDGAVVETDLDREVVIDDNLITSLPTAVLEFADVVAAQLSSRAAS